MIDRRVCRGTRIIFPVLDGSRRELKAAPHWQNLLPFGRRGTLTLMNPQQRAPNGSMMQPELNIGPTVTLVAGVESQGGIVMS